MLRTKFGERLFAYRNENNISRPLLVKKTGISRRTIQNWEYGISEPKYSDAKKIADYLGVSLSYLCGYDLSEVEKFLSIRDFIRWNMREKGITNKSKFASAVGLSAPTMSNILKGTAEPKLNNIVDMLREFGYGTNELV